MAKFYLLSPQGVPMNQVLFPAFAPTIKASGHSIVDSIENADVVLWDLHCRSHEYSQSDLDYIRDNYVSVATFDEWDRGFMSSDVWPYPLTRQQEEVFWEIKDESIHFCRLLDNTKQRPPNLHPYEKPILYEGPILPPDDLFNREFDVVYIANDAPNRQQIAEALKADERLKCYISLGAKKLEFDDFLRMHRRGKFFISSAAGGYTDERVQCLFSVAAIIRQRTDQLVLHDFTHLDNCLRIDSPPTKQDLDTLVEICADQDKLFEVYQRGYNFVKQFYSPEYIANDILQKILSYAA